MKKLMLAALALMPAAAFSQSMVITLKSGETVKFPVTEIQRMAFSESVVTPPEVFVPLSVFTDNVLRDAVKEYDKDGDDQLSEAEIADITELSLYSSQVESLEGINYLTALKELNIGGCMKLTEVDLSGMLDNLEYLQAGFSSNLTSLKLGSKPALKDLYTQYTGISALDLSGCPAVEELSIASTKITSFEYAGTALWYLSAGSDVLETVNLDGCTALKDLSLSGVSKMSGFDISKFPQLEKFSMTNSKISSFDTSDNPNLIELTLNNSENLTTVNVSKSMKLSRLSCYSCWELSKVIMTEGQVITGLYGVSSSIIEYVAREWPSDVASTLKNEAFRTLMLSIADTNGDGLITKDEALDVTTVNGSNKGLTEVDFTWFPNITDLNLSDNELTAIELWPMLKLEKLNLNNNKLTGTLDVSRQESLHYLYANNNQLTALSDLANHGFVEIELAHNKLTTVKITYHSKLTRVDVSYNELTNAEILGNDILAYMDVSHNKIEQMTLWSLKKLVDVRFNDNPFTQLDEADRWTILENIDCSNTNIKTLNLSKTEVLKKCVATGCPDLTTIYIGNNTSAEIVKDANTNVVEGAPAAAE